MKVKITIYKQTGKFYTDTVAILPNVEMWDPKFITGVYDSLPAHIPNSYITVEDLPETPGFHQVLYRYEELVDRVLSV